MEPLEQQRKFKYWPS